MMNSSIVRYAELPPMPWKNGKGFTRTLFSDAAASIDEWTWKISIAEINGTQPYSAYPGIRRGQVALGPGSVDLEINGQLKLLPVEGTIVFEGEDDVVAKPACERFLDLNVMGLRSSWDPSVEIVESPIIERRESCIQVLVALGDTCTVNACAFSRLDSVMLDETSEIQATGRFVLANLSKV